MAKLSPTPSQTTNISTTRPSKLHRRAAIFELCAVVACLQGSAAQAASTRPVSNVETPNSDPYIQDMLKRTEEKREERAKARLKDYYRRNFKDYFDFESGAGKAVSSDNAKDIKQWLKDNP